MFFSLATAAVCFVACHGGPADHFSTFAEELTRRGYEVHIYASGPALKKFQERGLEGVISFSVDAEAADIAKQCSKADVVITDVGHPFDLPLQQALAQDAPATLRLAYYDNPESFVPGGYSTTAAKVMQAAHRTLFANANLAPEKEIGLGYYPLHQPKKIAEKRSPKKGTVVYMGGNNEEYFSKAFPAFLQFLAQAVEQTDLSHLTLLLQQHPGAKEKNLDGKLMQQWVEQNGHKPNAPALIMSDLNSEEAQIVADQILYYQTSMGPQFVLAGIPVTQVGHAVYEDILVKNHLCLVATGVDGLVRALTQPKENLNPETTRQKIEQGLGIHSDWGDRLEGAIAKHKIQ
jgi:hypothetical protein